MSVLNGEVVKVTIFGEGSDTQDVMNVWHVQNLGTTISDTLAMDDMVELLEALYALLSAVLSTAYIVRKITGLNVSAVPPTDVGTGLFVDNTPGANAGTIFPPQNAAGLVLTTSRLKVRGRKFFGLVCEDQADDSGILSGAAILDLADVGDYATAPQVMTNNSWRFGVLATLDGAFLPFLSYAVPTSVVTQRRRRLGVGS